MESAERVHVGDLVSETQSLSALADLHDRGALTDEEFSRAKARLLRMEIDMVAPQRQLTAPPPPPSAPPRAAFTHAGGGLSTPVPSAPAGATPPDEATGLPRLYRRIFHLHGPQHPAFLARRAGVPQDEVEEMLDDLTERGLVHRHPNGLVEIRPGAPMPRAAGGARSLPQPISGTAPPSFLDLLPPRLGVWLLPVLLTGVLGGAIGFLVLNRRDERRARHVLKWGAIVTIVSIFLWVVGVAATIVLGSGNSLLPW